MEKRDDWRSDLLEIAEGRLSPPALREKLRLFHESDIAAVLPELGEKDRQRLFRSIENEQLSDTFGYIDDPSRYLEEMPVRKRVEILSLMDENDAAGYIRNLSKSEREMLLSLMDEETRETLSLLVSFEEDEFGSVMTRNMVTVLERLNVREARRSLVRQAATVDNIQTIYVVDDENHFYGAVDLKDLICARDLEWVRDIAVTSYPYVYIDDSVEENIGPLKAYNEDSIPVLDDEDRLMGVVTAEDMVKLLGSEMNEDYAKLGGLSAEEDLREPLVSSVKKRLPWLLILLALGLVVSYVVGLFEEVVKQLTLIIAFQSLILDMAGNVGTQSLAVTIRVLMDERVTKKDRLRLMWKETKTGIVNGLILAILSTLVVGCYITFFKGQTAFYGFTMSGCIGLSLMVAMTASALAGTAIPMLFKAMKIDPAVASGPFITTLNDLIAVITYYGLSWILLIKLIHLA